MSIFGLELVGSALSVRRWVRLGSTLSVFNSCAAGSVLVGSSFSTEGNGIQQGICSIGSDMFLSPSISVVAGLVNGGQVGLSTSGITLLAGISVSGQSHSGSTLSVRGFARLGSSLSVSGPFVGVSTANRTSVA